MGLLILYVSSFRSFTINEIFNIALIILVRKVDLHSASETGGHSAKRHFHDKMFPWTPPAWNCPLSANENIIAA
jgi:hypothetical protein